MFRQTTKQNRSQNTVIYLLYASIIVTILSGIFINLNSRNLSNNGRAIAQTYEILVNIEKINSIIREAESGQRGFLLTGNPAYLDPYNQARNTIDAALRNLDKMISNNDTQKKRVARLKTNVKYKMNELNEVILVRNTKGFEATLEAVASDKGKNFSDIISSILAEIEDTEKQLLEQRNQTAIQNAEYSGIIQILSVTFSLAISFVAIFTILNERAKRIESFAKIDQQTKDLVMDLGAEQQIDKQNEEAVLRNLIQCLENAKNFIQQIGDGNYDVEMKGITPQNAHLNTRNLAGELINMRNKMREVAEKEKQRNWATEGLAKFSDILRQHNNSEIKELAEAILSNLIKYIGAVQGGLYILEENPHRIAQLELVACYAFERKKYKKQFIEIGEGLIGQTFLERQTVFMTDLPPNYAHIVSGLGTTQPHCLLIVPLVINQEAYGVLEILSYQVLQPYQIDFVERLTESITSTIVSARGNARTKYLLVELQRQTEQLRAQEEEMRQNAEELQATQDEMQRRQNALEQLKANLEKEINQRTQELKTIADRYELMANTIPQGFWEAKVPQDLNFNRETEFWWNDKVYQILGYTQEEFPNKMSSWSDRIHPEDKSKVFSAFMAHLKDQTGKTPYEVTYRLRMKDGNYHTFYTKGTTLRAEDGTPIKVGGVIGKVENVT
ncbi:MAG: CHASE3 domain-containing protein [Microscillaceae bacterium]|nr:CHASE3 domain-containing protein [Microscillaceae bacterium]MDW8460709.1 CHASE3 domain-containing protein [Cytophagales bacterium]